jgi:DNA-binding MarR family transcriptional regulator
MSVIPLKEIAESLNDVSWDILDMLARKENINSKEIRDKLKISNEKLYKELARLEGALLIGSKRDPKDKRYLMMNLTQYGIGILELK